MPALKAIFSADAAQLYEVLSHGIPQRLRGLRQELNSVFRSGPNKSTIFNPAQEKNSVREYGEWWVSTLRDQSVRAATRSNEARRLVRQRHESLDKAAAIAAQQKIDADVESASRSNQARRLQRQRNEAVTASDIETASRSNQARRLLRQRAENQRANSFGGRVGDFFRGVAGSFLGVGAAVGAIYKMLEFATSSVKVNIQLQQMFNTLKTVSGSALQAGRDIEFLKQASNKLGFSFLESGATFARFSAASTAAGLSSEKTRKVFLGVQEAALVMGMTTDQTSSVMLALEQMLSKGTVMSQELRLQLGNSMPGAMNIFARALNVSQSELYKMVENGLVPAKEAVQLFGLELQKSFTLTPESNKTMREITRMTNAIIEMKAAVGSGLAPVVEGAAGNIGFWAKQAASGGLIGKTMRFVGGMNPLTMAGNIGEMLGAPGGGVKINPKLEAESNARKVAKIELEQAALITKLRADAAKIARAKDLESAAKIDKRVSDKQRDRELGEMPHDKKVEALKKNVKSLENDISDNQLYYTETQLAQRRLDLEDARDDLSREMKNKPEHRNSQSAILTDQERHGASMGAGVTLLDTTKNIHREIVKLNNFFQGHAGHGRSQREANFGGL